MTSRRDDDDNNDDDKGGSAEDKGRWRITAEEKFVPWNIIT